MALEDLAQDIELRQWELNNLNRQPLPHYEPGDPGYGPEECEECGAEMHPVRRAMGAVLCVDCKTRHDRRGRGY